jgi:hypothetical protein
MDYLSFNGSTQAIKLATRASVWMPSLAGISVTIKFRFTNGAQRGILWTDRPTTTPYTEYYIDVNNAGHLKKVQFAGFASDTSQGFNCYSDNDLNDGLWHIITVIKTAINSHAWYIDGVPQASQPGSTSLIARNSIFIFTSIYTKVIVSETGSLVGAGASGCSTTGAGVSTGASGV